MLKLKMAIPSITFSANFVNDHSLKFCCLKYLEISYTPLITAEIHKNFKIVCHTRILPRQVDG
ncbi:MAG: hypothetical protein IJU40_05755 [Desulfovibrionaceae bacterium]|nr:hypothetical protein [Desulfovibrionaceae bacterium]